MDILELIKEYGEACIDSVLSGEHEKEDELWNKIVAYISNMQ